MGILEGRFYRFVDSAGPGYIIIRLDFVCHNGSGGRSHFAAAALLPSVLGGYAVPLPRRWNFTAGRGDFSW